MNDEHLVNGVVSGNLSGVSPVGRARVHARSKELAVIAGRGAHEVSQADYEQAKREITGQSDRALQDAILDAPPAPGVLGAEPLSTAAQPLLSENELRHRVESFQVADLGAVGIDRNRLPYRRMSL